MKIKRSEMKSFCQCFQSTGGRKLRVKKEREDGDWRKKVEGERRMEKGGIKKEGKKGGTNYFFVSLACSRQDKLVVRVVQTKKSIFFLHTEPDGPTFTS